MNGNLPGKIVVIHFFKLKNLPKYGASYSKNNSKSILARENAEELNLLASKRK